MIKEAELYNESASYRDYVSRAGLSSPDYGTRRRALIQSWKQQAAQGHTGALNFLYELRGSHELSVEEYQDARKSYDSYGTA